MLNYGKTLRFCYNNFLLSCPDTLLRVDCGKRKVLVWPETRKFLWFIAAASSSSGKSVDRKWNFSALHSSESSSKWEAGWGGFTSISRGSDNNSKCLWQTQSNKSVKRYGFGSFFLFSFRFAFLRFCHIFVSVTSAWTGFGVSITFVKMPQRRHGRKGIWLRRTIELSRRVQGRSQDAGRGVLPLALTAGAINHLNSN